MHSYEYFRSVIEKVLADLKLTREPAELYEPIRYTLNLGGKRIRPVSTLMACEAFGEDYTKAIPLAVSMELFHNFTLLHDDIMDNADMRRGKPTVHVKWDISRAILSGDMMYTLAYEQLEKMPPSLLPGLLGLFNQTAEGVCKGQQWDMNFERERNVSLSEYLTMIEHKTAVLLGACLKMGAVAANADQPEQDKIYAFGKNLGIAFQLKDDILDTFGESGKTGKKVGGDIAAKKKTVLLVKALEKATGAEKTELNKYIDPENQLCSDEQIDAVIDIFTRLRVKEDAGQIMNHHYNLANNALDSVNIPKGQKAPLLELMNSLMERES